MPQLLCVCLFDDDVPTPPQNLCSGECSISFTTYFCIKMFSEFELNVKCISSLALCMHILWRGLSRILIKYLKVFGNFVSLIIMWHSAIWSNFNEDNEEVVLMFDAKMEA